jgi:hypothetical protein
MQKAVAVLVLVLLAGAAQAQTFVGGGVGLVRSSSPDPSPNATGDGGNLFPSVYAEAGLDLPRGFQARILAEYNQDATFETLFRCDECQSRYATSEVRVRPELRYWIGGNDYIQPFIAGGVDYYRQSFRKTSYVPAGDHDDEYEHYGLPQAGINPTFTVGARLWAWHEASFTRLFADRSTLNSSELEGYRVGYSYTRPFPFGSRFKIKVGGEIDYVTFRESDGHYSDYYYERDVAFKVRLGLIFK